MTTIAYCSAIYAQGMTSTYSLGGRYDMQEGLGGRPAIWGLRAGKGHAPSTQSIINFCDCISMA